MINLILALIVGAHAGELGAYLKNREGLRALGRKDSRAAYRAFTGGLAEAPLEPALQLNLAATFEQTEDWAKAIAAYRGVLALLPKEHPQRFEVLFNLANAQAAAKHIPEALAAYQEALELKPESIEVKTNIELLFAGGQGEGKGQSSDEKESEQKDDPRTNQQKREDALKDQKPEKKDGDKPKPKPFESKDLTAEDVKRILDEIKNQEQSIRAEEYDKNPKDAPRGGKDW